MFSGSGDTPTCSPDPICGQHFHFYGNDDFSFHIFCKNNCGATCGSSYDAICACCDVTCDSSSYDAICICCGVTYGSFSYDGICACCGMIFSAHFFCFCKISCFCTTFYFCMVSHFSRFSLNSGFFSNDSSYSFFCCDVIYGILLHQRTNDGDLNGENVLTCASVSILVHDLSDDHVLHFEVNPLHVQYVNDQMCSRTIPLPVYTLTKQTDQAVYLLCFMLRDLVDNCSWRMSLSFKTP